MKMKVVVVMFVIQRGQETGNAVAACWVRGCWRQHWAQVNVWEAAKSQSRSCHAAPRQCNRILHLRIFGRRNIAVKIGSLA